MPEPPRRNSPPAAPTSSFLSRDELLAGMPARRASTVLYAIESRTARLILLNRQALTHVLNERSATVRERAFLEAVAGARDLPERPPIQDIERFADAWAPLVPADPRVRAAVFHQLAERDRLPAGSVGGIRRALGVDEPAVAAAHEALYGTPITSGLRTDLELRDRLRWWRAALTRRIEEMPPFWIVYALTLTGTVGASTLALPIAISAVGLTSGLVILVVLGLLHVWTVAAMVEAVTRNGAIRYGSSYLGRMVEEYLGRTGTSIFTAAALLACTFALLIRYVGLSSTLEGGTGIAAAAWAGGMFAINLLILRRGSFGSTLTSTILVGAVNVALIAVISLIALPHVRPENLAAAGAAPAGTSGVGVLELVFGVVLSVYARHISIGSAAKLALRRDPSGRSLVGGTVAALASSIVLYCIWVAAVAGAVPARVLASTAGTSLTPLAERAGPAVDLLGGTFAILSMGIGSIYMSLVLFQHVQEWLPHPRDDRGGRVGRTLAGPTARFAIAAAPIVAIFVIVELLILAGRASFTAPIAFVSAITGPVLSGVFPMVLLAAARRRGEYIPGAVLRAVGHPLSIVGVAVIFIGAILVHGFVIWSDPLPRAAAVLTGIAMIAMNVVFVRLHAFTPRTVIEARAERYAGAGGVITVTTAGDPAWAVLRIEDVAGRGGEIEPGSVETFDTARRFIVELPAPQGGDLLVWTHRVTDEGRSEPIDARVEVASGGTDLGAAPRPGAPGRWTATLGGGAATISVDMPRDGR